jgi:cobalt-zinc-cadmium efflux system membrane fusion protein
MQRSTRFRASACCGILALVASTACSKGGPPPASHADSSKGGATADMPGMPGMGATSATALPKEITFTPAQVQHGGVRWDAVTTGVTATGATVPGEVIPNEDRTARLGAPGRGRVIDVRVRPGDRVSPGQVLVTLQSTEAGMAQSDVAKAASEVTSRRSQAQYAASARARAERLLALKAIPRQDYERAIADDEQARAALAQSEAELVRARTTASQLGAGAASGAGEIVIRSPMSGVVLSRTGVPGSVVEAGAPLVLVTDPSTLWLSVSAPEQFASLFHRGGMLRFTVPAYPADSFSAIVDAVGAGLDPDTRTLAVRGGITSGTNRLKPAMLASVVVEGGRTVAAVMLPEDAVQLVQGKPTVFIARPDGKGGVRLERREVEVGSRSGGRVAVTRGLGSGDVVVTAGAFAVKAEFQKATMPKMEM